jgi:acyl-CoA thioesterase-1
MRSFFLILVLLLPLQSVAAASKKLLIAGDSLSAGYGLTLEQSWPVLLQQQLTANNSPWQIHNASISGETSAGVLARLPALLSKHNPDVVLIEIGGNDGLRGFPPAKLRQNLQQIINMVKQQQSVPVLMQIRIPPNYGPRYTEQFEAIYPALASQNEIMLWPFFMDQIAINPALMLPDGIHPNAKAQPIIRDFVAKLIAEM